MIKPLTFGNSDIVRVFYGIYLIRKYRRSNNEVYFRGELYFFDNEDTPDSRCVCTDRQKAIDWCNKLHQSYIESCIDIPPRDKVIDELGILDIDNVYIEIHRCGTSAFCLKSNKIFLTETEDTVPLKVWLKYMNDSAYADASHANLDFVPIPYFEKVDGKYKYFKR